MESDRDAGELPGPPDSQELRGSFVPANTSTGLDILLRLWYMMMNSFSQNTRQEAHEGKLFGGMEAAEGHSARL